LAKRKGKKLDAKEDFKVPAKQDRLPTMEDTAIAELEAEARKYAAIRDKRMRLSQIEKDQKNLVHALMVKNSKRGYRHGGVEIEIVVESETVKVKILSPEEQHAHTHNANPAGENRPNEETARSGDPEPGQVDGESTEADEEASEVGDEGDETELAPPF